MNNVALYYNILFIFALQSFGFLYVTSFTSQQRPPRFWQRRHSMVTMQANKQSIGESNENIESVYIKAKIDYSAANEYIHSHYNISQYFEHDCCIEEIHDGRRIQSLYCNEREMLKDTGLAIVNSPISIIDWTKKDSIQKHYLPELERVVNKLFPENITHLTFWNPMMRGESLSIPNNSGQSGEKHNNNNLHTPTANIAPLVHIDTDIGAHENIEEVLEIIENNRIPFDSTSTYSSGYVVKDIAKAIVSGRQRFAIVNFWRNVSEEPITRAPLAIYSPRYDGCAVFPDAAPTFVESKWYMYPEAMRDEVILFYQYDRDRNQPSDLWHCAIEFEVEATESTLRRSFDIRAFILFDSKVSNNNDRYAPGRTRPILSFEESGCFCDDQAAKRMSE